MMYVVDCKYGLPLLYVVRVVDTVPMLPGYTVPGTQNVCVPGNVVNTGFAGWPPSELLVLNLWV